MSDICPACNTTMTTVPSEHDGATGYYVCPHCNGDCEHGRQRRKCETCSAWESAVYNFTCSWNFAGGGIDDDAR